MSQGKTLSSPLPLSPENVTPSWLSEVLGEKISSKDFIMETNVHAGSGFLSDMVRIHCRSENDVRKEFKLIIKLLPKNEMMLAALLTLGLDKTEIYFYQKTLPDLVRILPSLEGYLCHPYYEDIQEEDESKGLPYASVLILEDLKPQNYYTINFAGQETHEQITEVLDFEAKFHFAGMALEHEKKKTLPELYDFLQQMTGWEDGSSVFNHLAKEGFGQIDEMFNEQSVSEKMIQVYQKLAPHSDAIVAAVKRANMKNLCLVHGDLWSNNLLFNKNTKLHTKVIDWQIMGYKDPSTDVAVTIVSSIDPNKLTMEAIEKYAKSYYKTFSSHCDEKGLERRSWEDFWDYCKTWAMVYTLLWFVMATDPFRENLPRLIKIYEFLAFDAKVPEFLFNHVLNLK